MLIYRFLSRLFLSIKHYYLTLTFAPKLSTISLPNIFQAASAMPLDDSDIHTPAVSASPINADAFQWSLTRYTHAFCRLGRKILDGRATIGPR